MSDACEVFPGITDLAPAFCAKRHRKAEPGDPCRLCEKGKREAAAEAAAVRSGVQHEDGRATRHTTDAPEENGGEAMTEKKKMNCHKHGEFEGYRSDSPCPKCKADGKKGGEATKNASKQKTSKPGPRAETRRRGGNSTDTDVLEALVAAGYIEEKQVEFARRLLGVAP